MCVSRTGCLLSAVQPNKVYVGSLPEHTRQEDLQSCFGKIGHILNIELKYVPFFFISSFWHFAFSSVGLSFNCPLSGSDMDLWYVLAFSLSGSIFLLTFFLVH